MILADSINWTGERLISIICDWPTVKLAELRTHRVISQFDGHVYETAGNDSDISMNANSSRAIPINKQLQSIKNKMYIPLWTKNQKGMQGSLIEDDYAIFKLKTMWNNLFFKVIRNYVNDFVDLDIHKQDATLLLNPFSYTTCVLTATEKQWQHFIELRTGVMVYPAVKVLAIEIENAIKNSKPTFLKEGEWHLVFKDETLSIEDQLKVSVSKCALISYDNQDIDNSLDLHINRFNKLVESMHFSTCEHQYRVPTKQEYENMMMRYDKYFSNIPNWIQLRKIIEHERRDLH